MSHDERMRASLRDAFGETVKVLRKKQGIAQERLALLSGIDRAYMGMLERGEHTPSIELIHKVICGLNIAPVDFWREFYRTFERVRKQRKLPLCPKGEPSGMKRD